MVKKFMLEINCAIAVIIENRKTSKSSTNFINGSNKQIGKNKNANI